MLLQLVPLSQLCDMRFLVLTLGKVISRMAFACRFPRIWCGKGSQRKQSSKALSVLYLWFRSTLVYLKFTFLAKYNLLFQYLDHVRGLQIIHCHMLQESVPSLSVQPHKYPWVLCAFSCKHQLFNTEYEEEEIKILELIYLTIFHYGWPYSKASVKEQTLWFIALPWVNFWTDTWQHYQKDVGLNWPPGETWGILIGRTSIAKPLFFRITQIF